MPLVELRNLEHRFEENPSAGLHGVTVGIDSGEFVLLAGPSGSGKTLLVRHLNGLLEPTAGSVLFDGQPLHRRLHEARLRIGMVFQEPDHQIVGQTVEEDIAFGPRNAALPADEIRRRVEQSATTFELTGLLERDPRTLSGGEKRRLALAGIFSMRPSIIVCDEPFSNLDYAGVVEVLRALTRAHADGCGIVVVTHEVEKVLAHATRLIVLAGGTVRYDGAPQAATGRFEEWGLVPVARLYDAGSQRLSWLPQETSR